MNEIITVLSAIGGAAFALSGTAVAMKRGLDIFGGLVLGLLTACGGGVMRDIILGITPPAIFSDILYVGVSVGASVLLMLAAFITHGHVLPRHRVMLDNAINIADAVGLGIFTVLGTLAAMEKGGGLLLSMFTGTVTAVGGGMMRDICASLTPQILRRRIYALPTIAGSALFFLLYTPLGFGLAAGITIGVILAVRVLAAVFCWNLPIIPYET